MKQPKLPSPVRETCKVKPVSKWKVYGWSSFRTTPAGKFIQTREVALAPSKAAVVRGANMRGFRASGVGETGNDKELELARSKPGTIFYSDARLGKVARYEAQPHVPYDQPFEKKAEPTEVTLWVVGRDDGRVGAPIKLHSIRCKKHPGQYRLIKEHRGDTGGLAFDCGSQFELDRYDENPSDAIARYIRRQEDKVAAAKESIERAEATITAATLLYLKEPTT